MLCSVHVNYTADKRGEAKLSPHWPVRLDLGHSPGRHAVEKNKNGPTVNFLDVEGILVEFVLEDQLLQIVEGLLVNSLSKIRHLRVNAEIEKDPWVLILHY